MKISSFQKIQFGLNKTVYKVYSGENLVWDSGNLPPETEFPLSAVFAWDYDEGSDSDDWVKPKVGTRDLFAPVVCSTNNPFSPENCSELVYDFDPITPYISIANLNSDEMKKVSAVSGAFRLNTQEFPNPGWAGGDNCYLAMLDYSTAGGTPGAGTAYPFGILFGFEVRPPSSSVRGYFDLRPRVWKLNIDSDNYQYEPWDISYDGSKATVQEDQWFTWSLNFALDHWNFYIGSGEPAKLENIPSSIPAYMEKILFGGDPVQNTDGNYYVSRGCSQDNIALHDITNDFIVPTDTCSRYGSLIGDSPGSPDDPLIIIWDFNKPGEDAFESCSEYYLGSIASKGCNANGSCTIADPILPDQIQSCRLQNTLWMPDGGQNWNADKGMSYFFQYNDGGVPGCLHAVFRDQSERFYLFFETVWDATAEFGKNLFPQVTLYDTFSATPDVPDTIFVDRTQDGSMTTGDRFYVEISNKPLFGGTVTDDDFYFLVGTTYWDAGKIAFLNPMKEIHFKCLDVNWGNSVGRADFVSINRTELGGRFGTLPNGRDITVDKLAFWADPDAMGFRSL